MSGIKRLGVYVVFDKDGIVDDYIPYLLNDLKKNLVRLVVVCNGEINDEGRSKLDLVADDVFIRPNDGFDCGAVQDFLLNLYGWDRVYEYDELLIANDSFYGPLYPFKVVFDEMDKRDVDFWGLTESGGRADGSDTEINSVELPKHIQSYFINIKKRLLLSDVFRSFWESIKKAYVFSDALDRYELRLTETFVNCEFTYDCFLKDLRATHGFPSNVSPIFADVYTSIANYRSPIIKRKSLSKDLKESLLIHGSENYNRITSYIENETDYDVNLIWDNLLRTADIVSIKNTLHLSYILSTKSRSIPAPALADKRALVVVHMYYPELVTRCLDYVKAIPDYMDVIITTSRDDLIQPLSQTLEHEELKNVRILRVENRGRDIAALLIDCREYLSRYEYLCFTHDKLAGCSDLERRAQTSFMHILWENTLANAVYIENVISTFETNPRLGFLSVPAPYHSVFFSNYGNAWTDNYDITVQLSDMLGLKRRPTRENPSFSTGMSFWCRTAAMTTLFEHEFVRADFSDEPMHANGTISHAIERIFPYVAQGEGYFSGVVSSDTYAEVRNVDVEFMLNSLVSCLESKTPLFDFQRMLYELQSISSDILSFCSSHREIWLYGAGIYANRYAGILEEKKITYSGFLVSDGKPKKDALRGHPVKYISEIVPQKDDCGIILAVSRPYKPEILPVLENLGFEHIYEIS